MKPNIRKITTFALFISGVLVFSFVVFLNKYDMPASKEVTVSTPQTERSASPNKSDKQNAISVDVTTKPKHKPEAAAAEQSTPVTLEKHFSPTLEGTDIDGQIKLGPNGNIVLNLEVKDFIDYFLSASDEVSPEVAIEEMLKVVEGSLGKKGLVQVSALLDSYLEYKAAAMELMAQPMLPKELQTKAYQLQMVEETMAQMRTLRRTIMGPEAVDAFFGLEEAYEDFTLTNIKIQFDEQLTQAEKAALVSYHRSQLPEQIRKTEERVIADGSKMESIQEAMQAKDNAKLLERMDEFGYSDEQKAEIMAFKLSQEDFDRRYQEYDFAKRQQLASTNSAQDKARILDALRQEYFKTEQELTQAKVRDLGS